MSLTKILFSSVLLIGAGQLLADDIHVKYGMEKFTPTPMRNYQISERESKADLPTSLSLKADQTSIKNQGSRGSCSFFSLNALIESIIYRQQRIEINLSEEFGIQYTKGVLKEFANTDGSTPSENIVSYQRAGLVLENDLPFAPDWFEEGMPCVEIVKDSSTARSNPKCYSHGSPSQAVYLKAIKVEKLQSYPIPTSYSTLLSTKIMEFMYKYNRGVTISVPVSDAGWASPNGDVYHNSTTEAACKASPRTCGRHSILLVGFDRSTQKFIFKNSWNTSWGDDGYGTITFSTIDYYGVNPFSVFIPTRVEFPSQTDIPVPTLSNAIVYYDEDTSSSINVALEGMFSYLPRAVVKTGAGLYYRTGSYGQVSNFTTPSGYVSTYGKYIKGVKVWSIPEEQSIAFDFGKPLEMSIPHTLVSSQFGQRELFVNVQASIHTDTGWKTLYNQTLAIPRSMRNNL